MTTKTKTLPLSLTDAGSSEALRAAALRNVQAAKPARRSYNTPLGLPKGSVRAIITIAAIVGYAVAVGFAMATTAVIPESLSTIIVTIIAFYFGTRSAGKEVEGNEIEVEGNFSGEADRVAGSKSLSK